MALLKDVRDFITVTYEIIDKLSKKQIIIRFKVSLHVTLTDHTEAAL